MDKKYTQIPNDFLEAIVKQKIPSNALSILLFLIRKLSGWHREFDQISLSQIQKATGIGRNNIPRSIKYLFYAGILKPEKTSYRTRMEVIPTRSMGYYF